MTKILRLTVRVSTRRPGGILLSPAFISQLNIVAGLLLPAAHAMCWQRVAGRGQPVKSQKRVMLSPLNFVSVARRPSPNGPGGSKLEDVSSIVMNSKAPPSFETTCQTVSHSQLWMEEKMLYLLVPVST